MKSVLVTGASTGIGKQTVLRLASKVEVFAAVRRVEDAENLKGHMNVIPVILDITNQEHIEHAFKEINVALRDRGLYGLVNNAGIALAGPLEFFPLEDLRRQFEVNVFGQIALTQAFLPLLRKAQGRIVMVSSIAGRFASPLLGPYCSSKFALEGLSDSLRRELAPWGLKVSLVEPGRIKTPIWIKSKRSVEAIIQKIPLEGLELYKSGLESLEARVARGQDEGASPDDVARAIEHALLSGHPRVRYLVGNDARLGALLSRFLPAGLVDLLSQKIR